MPELTEYAETVLDLQDIEMRMETATEEELKELRRDWLTVSDKLKLLEVAGKGQFEFNAWDSNRTYWPDAD